MTNVVARIEKLHVVDVFIAIQKAEYTQKFARDVQEMIAGIITDNQLVFERESRITRFTIEIHEEHVNQAVSEIAAALAG